MNFNPNHIGPGTPPADSTTTERLAGFRQRRPPRIVTPPPRAGDAGDRPPRIQRTRRTVDLAASTHRALDIWQREAADRLGVARVTGQEVLTALIDQLLVDPKLAAQITRAIQERR